jgi:hypothetical protein
MYTSSTFNDDAKNKNSGAISFSEGFSLMAEFKSVKDTSIDGSDCSSGELRLVPVPNEILVDIETSDFVL